MEKKLFLLDGMALIFRSHFAFIRNPRINSKGVNTSAPMGFVNSLLEIINKEKPTHIGVAFDLSGPTFRHEMYKEYKAHRDETPEDIVVAIPIVKKIVDAFNIPQLSLQGYEADDVIGTLVHKARDKGFESYMMTPDKDYAQLVDENTFLFKPSSRGNGHETLGIDEVKEKFDIDHVHQVIDLLGLQGDSADNIPGVPGIGPKTASKLLKEYGSVEEIIKNAENIKGKNGERMKENAEQAILSKELATICIDAPIDFDEDALLYNGYNEEALKEIFHELEFRTLSSRMFGETKSSTPPKKVPSGGQMSLFDAPTKQKETSAQATEEETEVIEEETPPKTIHNSSHHYHLVETREERASLIQFLKIQKEFCFDTETTGLSALNEELVGLSFSYLKQEAYYVPFPEDQQLAQEMILEFKDVFEDSNIGKIGQNLKYDYTILQNYGIDLKGPLFDTMLAHYLLEPEKKHGMDYLSEVFLNYIPVSIETLIGKKGKKQLSMRDLPPHEVYEYACEDADITLQLKHVFQPMLDENPKIKELFEDIETPLALVLARMERAGIMLDTDTLEKQSLAISQEVENIEKEIYQKAGEEFNIASPKQLGEILFGKMKLVDKPKKTKSGQFATGEEVLQNLANDHDIIQDILNYRQLVKLKNTYVDALPKMTSDKDHKIHTTYNQTIAATGRLSSTDPNLQNIPIRTERGREVRKAFVPSSSDHLLLAADYSQVELRIMAAFSKDAHMIEAFQQGKDIHTATAAKIFKVNEAEVDADMRRKAKTANFGIIYGVSAFGLSQQLNIPRKEAGDLIKAYFQEFPSVKQYMDDAIEKAKEVEYTETILGRRRYLRDINSRNFTVRGMAERNAINAPIQGSAADIIKIAMINIDTWLQNSGLKTKMLLQVHDELVFDTPKEEVEIVSKKVSELMENALKTAVPFKVEIGTGNNWLEAH